MNIYTPPMDITRLTRQTHRRKRPGLALLGQFDLASARAHEFCGTARRRLALWLARAAAGPVLWIRPNWHPDRLHMAGLREEVAPGRLLFVNAGRAEDILWTAEEALRSGACPLVIADLPDPPGLTPVRRLHLAAEAGGLADHTPPICLLLTPGDGGAPGVESRWQLTPAHGVQGEAWDLRRLRARSDPPRAWPVQRDRRGTPQVAEVKEPAHA